MQKESKICILFVFLCVLYIMSFFERLYPAIIAIDLQQELGVSIASVGLFSGITMLVYGLMQMPSGVIADKIGAKRTIIVFSLLMCLSSFVFALSESYTVMFICRILIGIGCAVTVPCLALIAASFPGSQYATFSSIFLCTGGIGAVVAAPPMAYFSETTGWRFGIIFFSVLILITAIVVIYLSKSDKQSTSSVPKNKTNTKENLKVIFSNKQYWILSLWLMFNAGTMFTLSSMWFGPYLIEGCGLNKMDASIVMMCGGIAMVLSQPLMAMASDLLFKNRVWPMRLGSTLGFLVSCTFVFYTGEMSFLTLCLVSIGLMVFLISLTPLSYTMVKEIFPAYLIGTAFGCLNMFFPLYTMVLQSVYGLVLEYTLTLTSSFAIAYNYTSVLIAGNFFIVCILSFFMKETFIHHKKS